MTEISRRLFTAAAGAALAGCATSAPAAPRRAQLPDAIAAMRRATRFMTERAAYRGGYVWTYLPDFSRRWGEMEATPTMIWVEGPGTPAMGHALLDAFHATGEAQHLAAARAAADALVAGQHASGGWNTIIDFAGEAPLKQWYETVGANAWRLEEFQRFSDSATFDGAATVEAATLLLRLVSKDEKYRAPLDRAIKFVRDAQTSAGGWPERFPAADGAPISLKEDVALANITFLVMCYRTLGDETLLPAIRKAMDAYAAAQQPAPQAGWALYYTVADMKPAAGRSYEPLALSTQGTAANIAAMMTFYEMTGDAKFLARLPEALDWLDTVRLPDAQVKGGRAFPTFIEIGTNQPLHVHRFGSNVVNGEYFVNHEADDTIVHSPATSAIDTAALRARHDALKAMSREDAMKNSAIAIRNTTLPRFFTLGRVELADLATNRGLARAEAPSEARVREVIGALNRQGYWPTPIVDTSHPYKGAGAPTPAAGDFSQTRVGDESDTSPYTDPNPSMGISAATFIANMAVLTQYVDNGEGPQAAARKDWF
jgi:PelA/Pel-15E family pectate lyase